VLQVAKGLSATLGNDFFQSLVKSLGVGLHADCVYLGELGGTPVSRLTTVAMYHRKHKPANFEQMLSGTASGQVVQDGTFARSQDVQQLFPGDTQLESLGAEGFAGIRLTDSTGQHIGLLAVITKERMADLNLVKSLLEAFGPRAAAEIARKREYDLYRESEQRYQAFVSTNPDGMWRIEFEEPIPLSLTEEEQLERIYRTGYVAECNDAAARQRGHRSAHELVGWRLEQIIPRTDARLLQEVRDVIHREYRPSTIETFACDDTGNACYRLRSLFGVVEDGKLRRLWGTTRDITDLRKAELSAATSERRFRKVLEGVQLPAVMLDGQGSLVFYNDCFLRLASRSAAELQECSWLQGIILGYDLPAKRRQ
jgi:PAS domain-containing protein